MRYSVSFVWNTYNRQGYLVKNVGLGYAGNDFNAAIYDAERRSDNYGNAILLDSWTGKELTFNYGHEVLNRYAVA